MTDLEIFTAALDLEKPWQVEEVYFETDGKDKILRLKIGYKKGSKFDYDGEKYSVYDHQQRTWRHLDFFQHECYLEARVPRVKTKGGKVKLVAVPWAGRGSSFTLLFEDKLISLAQRNLSISGLAEELRTGWGQAQRIILSRTAHALSTQDLEDVKEMSVDETSRRKGHQYFTILADSEKKKVVGIAVGKDKEAFAHALVDMEVRGADRKKVETITMDMSNSYIAAAEQYLEQGEVIFDRFHIMQNLNKAVDEVRRTEQKIYKEELKRSRYLWLKNNSNLNEEQRQKVEALSESFPNIGRAYRLKEMFKEVMDEAYNSSDLSNIGLWLDEAYLSNIKPIQKFVISLLKHWKGVETYFLYTLTNALAERINLKIQEIKRTAKGFRNLHNFMLMIYFHLGGLKLTTH